jgi:two-component system, NtrC family, response regulator HydG
MHKIVVIDDDIDICHLLKKFLSKNNYEIATAHSGEAGIKLVDEWQPHLVLTDFRLGDMDGSAIIQRIKTKMPNVPILVVTGYSDIRVAVNVLKLGALDYIMKPILPQEILMTIHRTIVVPSLRPEEKEDVESNLLPYTTPPSVSTPSKRMQHSKSSYIMGISPAFQNLMHQINLVAATNYSTLIYGESGAGKEVVARMIHERSPRFNMPFVAVDCGAIPRELANSELFGHEKGAFTGAIGSKEGHFEAANGGTIFLDEVANLPYNIQILLLRIVQERKCRRIGGTKEINLDVRIIVASNERLSDAARKGKFREDLYYRFNEFCIDAPPLRSRKEDIMVFAEQFLKEANADLKKTMLGFDDDVVEVFNTYPWYGNIRELRNAVKRAALLSSGNRIQAKALPFEIINYAQLNFEENEVIIEAESLVLNQLPLPAKSSFFEEKIPVNLKETAQKVEYDAILKTLKDVRYNKSKAADVLGIDRKTLYNKLKKFRLEA